MLRDLRYKTNASSFIESVGERRDLVAIATMNSIDEIAPALLHMDRERVFEWLLESPSIPFIGAFNVLGIQVDIPNSTTYTMLKEITVDELNLTRILIMLQRNRFPVLESLTLFTAGEIELPIRSIRKLHLYNVSASLLNLPNLNGLILEDLELSGYVLEFQGHLPKRLKLEECLVVRSEELLGCEDLELIETSWKTLSYPTKRFAVEGFLSISKIPNTLKELTLIDVVISCNLPTNIDKLHLMKIGGSINFPKGAKTTTLTIDSDMINFLPTGLKNLYLQGTYIKGIIYPETLREIEILECKIDIFEFFRKVREGLEKLSFIKCQFASELKIIGYPKSLKELRFIKCVCPDSIIEVSNTLRKLVIIGKYPHPQGKAEEHIYSMTNILLMSDDEFLLFCIEKSRLQLFREYEEYHKDLSANVDRLREFLSYQFVINVPSDATVLVNVILNANPKTIVIIKNHQYTVERLRADTLNIKNGSTNVDSLVFDLLQQVVRSIKSF
jgi:hypothetical protein